jgi:hypothetical protein
LCHRKIKVLGYTRQHIQANWKLYAESTRDNYHAMLVRRWQVLVEIEMSAFQRR